MLNVDRIDLYYGAAQALRSVALKAEVGRILCVLGRNGGGDPYYTDGEIKVSRLVAGCDAKAETTAELDNPPLVDMKNAAWKAIAGVLQSGDAAEPVK